MSENTEVRKTIKNTGIVGVSQIITILISLIKTKVVAILLGPTGIGLIHLFNTTLEMLGSVFGLGVAVSGVRNISEVIAINDSEKLSRTVINIKRWLWFSGILGVILTSLFSKQISILTFGTPDYWFDISLLSITILVTNLTSAHSTIIRGARNITDFVKTNILSAIFGVLIAVPLYYFFGVKAVMPVLFITSIVIYIINYIYSSKIKLQKVKVSFKESLTEGSEMIKLGLFIVFTGLISTLTLYFVRITIGDKLGIEYVGYYSVVISLTVTYMGVIFNAMSADYYPKLGAINNDNKKINIAVLEQTKIVLLLGTPLVVFMYVFAEFIIEILYTEEFLIAVTLLQWMLISVFIRFIGYPIGYVFLAKGKSKIFIFTQTTWNILFVAFVLLSFKNNLGLEGIGISYTLAYFIGAIINVLIIKNVTGFKYDKLTVKYIVIFSFIIMMSFLVSYNFSTIFAFIIKFVGALLVLLFSLNELQKILEISIVDFVKTKLSKNK
ncbi:MAG: oligosaccharide flippase family protein [Ichthyobacteriaceae bacterium]|nr:oligosaccharide flippase family protein [Ichthyobacteriaceae bacterium]